MHLGLLMTYVEQQVLITSEEVLLSKPTNTNMTSLHAATPLHQLGTSLTNLT